MTEPGDMVERVARAIERELDVQELVLADPLTLRRLKAKRIATAALAASGADRMREALEACVKAMAIVTESNPMGVGKNDKCAHGRYGFEGCESCTDNTLDPALERARQALGEQP
jgi:hypothetical protein